MATRTLLITYRTVSRVPRNLSDGVARRIHCANSRRERKALEKKRRDNLEARNKLGRLLADLGWFW